MSQFFRLYLKELKSVYKMGLILFGMVLWYMILRIILELNLIVSKDFGSQLYIITLYIIPVILVYLLNKENMDQTVYQLTSLPRQKWLLIFSKFLAVMTIACVILFPADILATQFWWDWGNLITDRVYLHTQLRGLVLQYFGLLQVEFLYMSIVLFAYVVSVINKKHTIIIFALLAIAGFTIIRILDAFFQIRGNNIYTFFIFPVYIVFGMILFLSSLVLYEKFKEI